MMSILAIKKRLASLSREISLLTYGLKNLSHEYRKPKTIRLNAIFKEMSNLRHQHERVAARKIQTAYRRYKSATRSPKSTKRIPRTNI